MFANMSMKLYIKYMVSLRCKMVVKDELEKLGIRYGAVDLGMVETLGEVTEQLLQQLKENLLKSGLELLDDKRSILIEKIKNVIVEMIHYSDEIPKRIILIISARSSITIIPTFLTSSQK